MRGTSLYQSFVPNGVRDRARVWRSSPDYRRPRHFHTELELNLIVAGAATFGVGETIVRAAQGELPGFPAGQDHERLGAFADLRLLAIGISPEFSSQVLGANRHSVTTPLQRFERRQVIR